MEGVMDSMGDGGGAERGCQLKLDFGRVGVGVGG